jgi:hypothetical protein
MVVGGVYAHYRVKYRDDYIPVQVQVAANKALRACRKAGVDVPPTVYEFNHCREPATFTYTEVGVNKNPGFREGEEQ